ncbi:cytochrome P450 2A13-like isoform X1 [Podarcis raffonei]|uniref:cytochrome P450 2A13-like isoform X1 n=1 Tax=Podarcis raffonei TaxID=65483 RepID=UPI002329999A|nr:cytochrome P450 2A13-like isoform X1 [Podarcis raffonei]
MDLLGPWTLLLASFLFCLLLLSAWKKKEKLPPGPTPLPFIGNLLQVNTKDMYQSLMKIREKYGPVFTIHLGPRRVVVLCGYDAVKEALVDQAEEFSGRGEQATFDWLFRGYGVVFSNGERAKQLRRFSITTLRNFGMGRRSIEDRIMEEAHFLLESLRATKSAPFDPTYMLSRTVSNVISSIAFGDRFEYEDKEFVSLLSMMLGSFQFTATSWGQLYDMFSGIMQYLPGPQHKAFKQLLGLEKFIMEKVKDHEETLDPNAPRDFIDCFLVKMQQDKKNPNTEFFARNLVMTTLNIFFAGTETVSTTLRYGFLLLLKYPEVEADFSTEKVHKEIERVIGLNRTPNMDDRPLMPYTDAVIHEIQRFGDMLPLGVARRVTRDTQFRGYNLPKGTEVFPMLGSVLRDAQHFARPNVFDPQHFLDENGQFKKNEAFMPFSVGKRYCLGENLGRMELFLFFTSILQNFCLKSPVPREKIDISPMLVGFATIPHFYEMCAIPL